MNKEELLEYADANGVILPWDREALSDPKSPVTKAEILSKLGA
jgi:hypothetical protein